MSKNNYFGYAPRTYNESIIGNNNRGVSSNAEPPKSYLRQNQNSGSPFSQSNGTPTTNGTTDGRSKFNYTQTDPLRTNTQAVPAANLRTSAIDLKRSQMGNAFDQANNRASRGLSPSITTFKDHHVLSPSHMNHRAVVDQVKTSMDNSRLSNMHSAQSSQPHRSAFESHHDRPTSSTLANTYGQHLNTRGPNEMIFHDIREHSAPAFPDHNSRSGNYLDNHQDRSVYESRTINDPMSSFNMNSGLSRTKDMFEDPFNQPFFKNDNYFKTDLHRQMEDKIRETRQRMGLPNDPRESRLGNNQDLYSANLENTHTFGRQAPEYNMLDQKLNNSRLNGYPQPATANQRSPSPYLNQQINTNFRQSNTQNQDYHQLANQQYLDVTQKNTSNNNRDYNAHYQTPQHHHAQQAATQQRSSSTYRDSRPAPLNLNPSTTGHQTSNFTTPEEVYASTPGLDKYRSPLNLGLVGIPNIGHSCYM